MKVDWKEGAPLPNGKLYWVRWASGVIECCLVSSVRNGITHHALAPAETLPEPPAIMPPPGVYVMVWEGWNNPEVLELRDNGDVYSLAHPRKIGRWEEYEFGPRVELPQGWKR